MAVLPGDNGPDQGQLMAAACNRRSGGTQHEAAMLIEVRGGASRRFVAPHRHLQDPVEHQVVLIAGGSCRKLRIQGVSAGPMKTH